MLDGGEVDVNFDVDVDVGWCWFMWLWLIGWMERTNAEVKTQVRNCCDDKRRKNRG